MTQKHTPLPWSRKSAGRSSDFGVFGSNDRAICSTGGYSDGKDHTYDENIANAEFIHRACNAHYDMLEALKRCENVIDGQSELVKRRLASVRKDTRAAIANAEGGAE